VALRTYEREQSVDVSTQPLVVLTRRSEARTFHGYLREILDAEGFPWHAELDLDAETLTKESIRGADIVVVCAISLSSEEIDAVLAFAATGGHLVCMRPSEALALRAGIPRATDVRGVLRDSYVEFPAGELVRSAAAGTCLQFHGDADFLDPDTDGVTTWAWLALGARRRTKYPAIASRALGLGQVVVFAYDLAASTVVFRQGRRQQASTGSFPDSDGDGAYRPNDLFVGQVDVALLDVPQADLHQDVFVEVLMHLQPNDAVVPRVWHFPDAAPAVAFFNGDSDGMDTADLERTLSILDEAGVVFTTYLMEADYDALPPALMHTRRRAGHSFGVHAYAGTTTPSLGQMRATLAHEHTAFRERYGFTPISYRGHSVVWVGWVDMAAALLENGVRLDTSFVASRLFQRGYVTGSGLPMKFVNEEGELLDIYEQATLSTDDGWRSDKTLLPEMSTQECIDASVTQINLAVDSFNTVYHPYFHPICTRADGLDTGPWLASAIAHCVARGVPFVSDAEWVAFNDARRALRVTACVRSPSPGDRAFAVHASREIRGATLLLPIVDSDAELFVDGLPADAREVELGGHRQLAVVVDFEVGQERHFGYRRGGVT
jgi:hypothetical protein